MSSTGIEYNDVLRYFHGDQPATAAEGGQQYGGNFPCSVCGSHATLFDDLAYVLRQLLRSLDDRVKAVMAGVHGSKTKCKPYELVMCEPLHDYTNHVKNVLEEVKGHISQQANKILTENLDAIFQDKQELRECDWRDAAVLLPQLLSTHENKEYFPQPILNMLESLSELGELLYSRDSNRCPCHTD